MDIATMIKQLRNEKNLTQKALADSLNISLRSIINYENGLRQPNSKAMAALESYFNVSGSFLRGEAEEDSTAKWEEIEYTSEVSSGFVSLLKNLLPEIEKCSEFEQKMLFDLFVEIRHILGLPYSEKENDDVSKRALTLELIQKTFWLVTRFSDSLPSSYNPLDANRTKRLVDETSEAFFTALTCVSNAKQPTGVSEKMLSQLHSKNAEKADENSSVEKRDESPSISQEKTD